MNQKQLSVSVWNLLRVCVCVRNSSLTRVSSKLGHNLCKCKKKKKKRNSRNSSAALSSSSPHCATLTAYAATITSLHTSPLQSQLTLLWGIQYVPHPRLQPFSSIQLPHSDIFPNQFNVWTFCGVPKEQQLNYYSTTTDFLLIFSTHTGRVFTSLFD